MQWGFNSLDFLVPHPWPIRYSFVGLYCFGALAKLLSGQNDRNKSMYISLIWNLRDVFDFCPLHFGLPKKPV